MTRAGAFIGWGSAASVIAGCGLFAVIQYNLETANWVARPLPPGFGLGGSNDKSSACRQDILAFCPGVKGRGALDVCFRDHFRRLSPGCQAVIPRIQLSEVK